MAQAFESFGLTIVSQRRSWEDNGIESRSLPFFCEKSSKDIPTAELDEWIEEGMQLQAMLLYLRLVFWNQVNVDKSARIKGISDHRLTAAVLVLLGIQHLAPAMVANLKEVLQNLESRRRAARANSIDGIIINYLWEKIQGDQVGQYNGQLFIGSTIQSLHNDGTRGDELVPLQTSEIESHLHCRFMTSSGSPEEENRTSDVGSRRPI